MTQWIKQAMLGVFQEAALGVGIALPSGATDKVPWSCPSYACVAGMLLSKIRRQQQRLVPSPCCSWSVQKH